MTRDIVEQFKLVGRILFEMRLVDSHAGNLSVREGDHLWITTSGSKIGYLTDHEVMRAPLGDTSPAHASSEWVVHKAIYDRVPDAHAVVHCHPLHMIALGFDRDVFVPIDSEGALFAPQIPVIEAAEPSGSAEVAQKVAEALVNSVGVFVRTHGLFVKGPTLDRALLVTSSAARSAELLWLQRSIVTRT